MWVAKMANEYDWVLEGITLGVFIVLIMLPAIATAAFEDLTVSIFYILGTVLTSTVVWFYLNWRVLPPRPTEKLHNDSENC